MIPFPVFINIKFYMTYFIDITKIPIKRQGYQLRSIQDIKAIIAFIIVVWCLPSFSSAATKSAIEGQITEAETGEVVVGASITFPDKFGGTISDDKGNFSFKNIKPGRYLLQISHLGYEIKVIENVIVEADKPTLLKVELIKKPITIKGIVVTTGLYSIMGEEPEAKQTLSREIIESRPQLGDDIFRAVQRLPGISYNDFSAKFNVRGGEQDEVMISIDGLEIYEPFHLRDVDGGVISIIDVAAIEGVEFMSGGYPANFGNRMSGIFNIRSKTPTTDYKHFQIGLSAINARFLGEGTFNNKRGTWLVSSRLGYLDKALKIIGEGDELTPKYYDLFSKIQYKLSRNQILSFNLLWAKDDFEYKGTLVDDENNTGDTLISSYGNSYLWATLHSSLSEKLTGRSILSYGSIDQHRYGQLYDINYDVLEMKADDRRNFKYIGLKSDWELEANENNLFKVGFDIKQISSDYDYQSRNYKFHFVDYGSGPVYQLDEIEERDYTLSPKGNIISSYLSHRLRLWKPLTSEIGVRYEKISYTNEDYLSPRFNLAFSVDENTAVRFSWGYFYQPQRIDEIYVQDKETTFDRSERAQHFVLGFEHKFDTGENMRVQAFYKKYDRLNPSYRNTFGELVSFPELEEDRAKVTFNGKTAQGIEVYIKKDIGEKLSWYFSYVLSKVKDDIKSLYYYNENITVNYDKEFPFTYDQLHTLYLDMNYRFNHKWQLNLAWQFHTGWPYTEVFINSSFENNQRTYFVQSGEPWGEKLPDFKRLDLRLNRKFFTSHGTITTYVEVLNVLSETNVRNYEYVLIKNGNVLSLDQNEETWLRTMPSFGIRYDFNW